jgi:hypothetical protein
VETRPAKELRRETETIREPLRVGTISRPL